MIRLQLIERADKNRFRNVFQKYFYEMSAYYDLEMDSEGNYPYRYFDAYFEGGQRAAYFIFEGDTLIGFVMINDYSCLHEKIDYAIAEFTIFPKYRRKRYAEQAIRRIFEDFPGKWEIKFSNRNRAAGAFWLKVTESYAPRISSVGEAETALSFLTRSSVLSAPSSDPDFRRP